MQAWRNGVYCATAKVDFVIVYVSAVVEVGARCAQSARVGREVVGKGICARGSVVSLVLVSADGWCGHLDDDRILVAIGTSIVPV